MQGWALQSPTLKANVVQVRRDLYQHVGELDVHVWSFAYREIRQMRMHDAAGAARQCGGGLLGDYLTLVARSLKPRQSPAPNLQIDPAGQCIRERVTSDVDALAEIFDKIERSVAEDSLNGEAIKKRRRCRVVFRVSSK